MICTNNRCQQISIINKEPTLDNCFYISPSAMQRCYNAENTWKKGWLVGCSLFNVPLENVVFL